MKKLFSAFMAIALVASSTNAFAQHRKPTFSESVFGPKKVAKRHAAPHARKKLAMKAGAVSTASTPIQKLVDQLRTVTLDDLRIAHAIATKQGNLVAAQCWGAWIVFNEARESALIDENGQPLPMPTIHIITDIQNAIDLVNGISSTGPLGIACAPLANQVKMSAIGLITSLGTGAILAGVPIP